MRMHECAAADDAVGLADLLAAGNDINARDAAGMTPLMIAAAHGALQAHAWLTASGADYSLVDDRGCTAEDYAQAYRESLQMSDDEMEQEKCLAQLNKVMLDNVAAGQ